MYIKCTNCNLEHRADDPNCPAWNSLFETRKSEITAATQNDFNQLSSNIKEHQLKSQQILLTLNNKLEQYQSEINSKLDVIMKCCQSEPDKTQQGPYYDKKCDNTKPPNSDVDNGTPMCVDTPETKEKAETTHELIPTSAESVLPAPHACPDPNHLPTITTDNTSSQFHPRDRQLFSYYLNQPAVTEWYPIEKLDTIVIDEYDTILHEHDSTNELLENSFRYRFEQNCKCIKVLYERARTVNTELPCDRSFTEIKQCKSTDLYCCVYHHLSANIRETLNKDNPKKSLNSWRIKLLGSILSFIAHISYQ